METEYIEEIDHTGTVVSVNPGSVKVSIDTDGECGSCPAAKLCKGSEQSTLEIPTNAANSFKRGDRVILTGTEQMHRKAIMLATVLPCIALIAVMIIVYLLTFSQIAAALCGLGTTLVFFMILYLCRNKIAHEFNFTIKPLN